MLNGMLPVFLGFEVNSVNAIRIVNIVGDVNGRRDLISVPVNLAKVRVVRRKPDADEVEIQRGDD
jgi:hypothetical protein